MAKSRDPRTLSLDLYIEEITTKCERIRTNYRITYQLITIDAQKRLPPEVTEKDRQRVRSAPILHCLITDIEELVAYIKNHGSILDEEKYKDLLGQLILVLDGNQRAATKAIEDIDSFLRDNYVKCSILLNILLCIGFTLSCIAGFAALGSIMAAAPATATIGAMLMVYAFTLASVFLASSSFSNARKCSLLLNLAEKVKIDLGKKETPAAIKTLARS